MNSKIMLFVWYMLIICITKLSHFSDHGRNDDNMEIVEMCRDGVSQIALECEKCMNQDWCRKWVYGSPVPDAKCFDFCNSITQEIQCLRKLEAELEICTSNFELATINNQTTIKSLHLLNESLNNLSKSFKTFDSEQHKRLGNVDVQLGWQKSQINSIYHTVERKFPRRIKQLQLRVTRLQDEQKRYTDNSVVNVSSLLQVEIQNESNLIKKQLMSSLTSSETKIKKEIGVLTNTYDEYMKNIKTDQSKSESRLNTTVQKLSDNLSTVNKTTLFKLNAVKVQLKKQFQEHKAELKTVKTQLKDDFKDGIATISETCKKDIYSNMSVLEQKLGETKTNMTQETQALDNKIDSIDTLFRTMEVGLQIQIRKVKKELQLTINKQRSTIEQKLESKTENIYTRIEKKMRKMEQRIFKEIDKLTRQTQEVSQNVTTQKEKVDVIYINTFNKEMLQMAFLCLVVMVMINFAMVYFYRPSTNLTTSITGNVGGRFQSSIEILKQVPSKPELQAAVCIISFDEGRQAAHKQLLDSVNLPNYSLRVVTFVVRRHANIPDLPRCKVYLMCTEFSERHVIIEEQGLGLGDLHRTTYDAVLKLGGQLIILYTRDPGSRRLKDDEVYNKNIYCVTHQEELVELNNMGRFFSVYDALTTQQKTKLKQTIMKCFHLFEISFCRNNIKGRCTLFVTQSLKTRALCNYARKAWITRRGCRAFHAMLFFYYLLGLIKYKMYITSGRLLGFNSSSNSRLSLLRFARNSSHRLMTLVVTANTATTDILTKCCCFIVNLTNVFNLASIFILNNKIYEAIKTFIYRTC